MDLLKRSSPYFQGFSVQRMGFSKSIFALTLVARAVRNAIRANRFARIIRNWNPYFYSALGRFARITRISDSRESGDSRESCESIRANHATKALTKNDRFFLLKCWVSRAGVPEGLLMSALAIWHHDLHLLQRIIVGALHNSNKSKPSSPISCPMESDTQEASHAWFHPHCEKALCDYSWGRKHYLIKSLTI